MPAPYATIACFIEGGPACRVVLDEAIALRAQSEGVLQVVHIIAEPAFLLSAPFAGPAPTVLDEGPAARRWLDATVGDVPGAEPVMLTGYPPIAACDYAATANVDLVVAAAHRGIVNRTMLGGFASYVAYHAPCPVLLVHPPTPPAEG
jgi:nucleotide-binding universal stress UspA family protein